MKKFLTLLTLISILVIFAGCSGGSSNQSSSSNSSTSSSSDTTTNSNNTTSIIGDWKYEGTVNNKNYEIDLDLEDSNRFSLDVDEESSEETIDSETDGTYEATDSEITLSIETVQDTAGNFTGAVVQNEQVKLNYTLDDTGNKMTITNAKDSINFLPGELVLTKDD